MARLKLNLPKHFIFETELTVRVGDLNYGGHVGNDRMLLLMQEARVMFYKSLGYKDELSFTETVGQIITDAAVIYKSESFLGDVLTIKIAIEEFTKYGFDMLYLITNTATGKEVAQGKTGILCFDYTLRKVASIPENLLKSLKP